MIGRIPRSRVTLSLCSLLVALLSLTAPSPSALAQTNPHTDPLNLTPEVREAHVHFYNLDYDGALSRFEAIQRANPQNPMAANYVLLTLIFRELYHQDLLDTTYYAHDSFIFSKRDVFVAQETRDRIEKLTDSIVAMCDQQIKASPGNPNLYFARGYAKGMHSAFITLAFHSYVGAARQGLSSRQDSEEALRLDPQYADAKMAIGIQQFAVASLPRLLRIMIGITGVTGNKEKGLDLLRQCAAQGTVNRVECRTSLTLFLRHDARYPEALTVMHGLSQEFPHDYLFRLEEANIAKDKGDGPTAITTYKAVLADAARPGYFTDPRLQMAYFGLAETQRGQNQVADAAQNYVNAATQPKCSDWVRRRAQLAAGQMFDLLHQRDKAVEQYKLASAPGGDQSQADTARKYLKNPYTGS